MAERDESARRNGARFVQQFPGELELGVGNLDNVYAEVLEEAASAYDDRSECRP